jgi:hypothetical protein
VELLKFVDLMLSVEGVDVNARNRNGNENGKMTFMIAAKRGNFKMIRLLVNRDESGVECNS